MPGLGGPAWAPLLEFLLVDTVAAMWESARCLRRSMG